MRRRSKHCPLGIAFWTLKIDTIISDYDMPGMDGIKFLREVRKIHPTIPFIIFPIIEGQR